MTDIEQKIHDFVNSSTRRVNSNQVFQGLRDAGVAVTIQKVHDTMVSLAEQGFLVGANLPSYFAV